MHYVYLTDNVVTDQAQVDPSTIFYPEYASQFIEAPDEVTFGWTLEKGVWVKPNTDKDVTQQNQLKAMQLLQATDWTQVADVPLLNKQEFTDYRATVRAIALNPPVEATFPQLPTEQWS